MMRSHGIPPVEDIVLIDVIRKYVRSKVEACKEMLELNWSKINMSKTKYT